MTSLIKNIYICENEKDVLDSLRRQGINTKVFENKLAGLFNRVYNNYVGYYIFKQDEIIYKLIILPKTIKIDDNTERNFVNYLLHYYRINYIYDLNKEHNIPDSLLALAFEKNNDEKNSHLPLDDFEFYKYKSILLNIEQFFKRHKNYKRINVDHISQTIKYKLNLKKNIKELDKTNIHQSQTKDILYSLVATVTINALKLFLTHRIAQLTFDDKKSLQSLASRIKNDIEKKYAIDKSYKLSLAKLNSFQTIKRFRSTTETKQLLVNIKTLFGFEHMYNDDVLSIESRFDLQTSSFFIDPIYFYEWYVYDILKSYAEKENKCILFDKLQSQTSTEYLISNKNTHYTKISNPDYIIIDEANKTKVIIDAKWKNIYSLAQVSSSDYLKLQLDTSLQLDDNYTITSSLIYPNLDAEIKNTMLNMSIDEKKEVVTFNFNVLEVDMNFRREKNTVQFIYDDNAISSTIKSTTKIEELKTQSVSLSHNIDMHRSKVLTNILKNESIDEKDNLLQKLDNHFLKSAEKLYNKLDEQPLLPEIQHLLDSYSEVLEEESIKFLKSSSAIYRYYSSKKYPDFDYSMPGSGLWKLIELELNTSFVWYIRMKNNVCNSTSPWEPISKKNMSISIRIDKKKTVHLNNFDYKHPNRLQGLMLGGIKLLLSSHDVMHDFENFHDSTPQHQIFLANELSSILENVSGLRNDHAHIKAMSLPKFIELYSLLFEERENGLSNIQKLLEFKLALQKVFFTTE